MSITPMPVGPARVAPAGAHGSQDRGADEAAGGTFADLVASLLGGPGTPSPGASTATGGQPGEPSGGAAAGLDPAVEAVGDAAEAPDTGIEQAPGSAVVLPSWLSALGVSMTAPAAFAPPAPVPGTTGEGAAGVAVADGAAASALGAAAADAATQTVAGTSPSTVPPAAASYDASVAGGEPRPTASPSTPGTPLPPPGAGPVPEDTVPAAAGLGERGADAAPTAPTTTPTGPAATAPATAAPVVPATTPTAPAEGARPVPVVSQVVPEVTRLVSRGDGVHRLTMRLQPEGLGDVRVTLTVRDGEVDVRLAAGDDARRALLEGAPELRRVLELAGATEARVLVRDLAGSTAPGGQQAWSQAGPQPGHQDSSTGTHGTGGGDASGRGEGGEQDQHARTRGGAAARDGLTDGATTLRPDPTGRAPRGVDLTM